MSENQGVLICGEANEEKITTVTAELLNTGRKLSEDLKQPLCLLLIGQKIQEAAQEAIALGADKIYTVDGPLFSETLPEHLVFIITHICEQIKPAIILFGQTDMGREIAPRVGAKLDAGICLDCIKLEIDPATKSILQIKPVYGGNAVAIWTSKDCQLQVVTMRPRSIPPAEPDVLRTGEVIPIKTEFDKAAIQGKLIKTKKEEIKGIRLEEAKVIVTGGGGINGREGFQLVQELAQVLLGAIGISRVPCDEGWMPSSLEIGQTGHVVSPNLYIAVGISGAPQHLAGCSGSKCIVAINKDPEAHIFKEADFGIVGDYREALPPLIEKLKTVFKA